MLEILMIYSAISLILIPIFRLQGAVHGYAEAKEYVFICLSALAFIGMLFTGIPVLSGPLDMIFLSFVAYITLSVYWSDSPSIAVKDVPRWWAIFIFYLACSHVPRETLMMALFLPSPVIVLYGLWQQIMKRDPLDHWVHDLLKKQHKKLRFYSFLGNSNYTGSYLLGAIFAGGFCVANVSYWFIPALALVLVGMVFTRCRGAWFGVVAGLLGAIPEAWPFMIIMSVVVIIFSWGRMATLKTRVHFLNVGWTMFKERFLLGWGPASFRRKIFKTQAFMNQMNPRLLGTLKKRPLIETPLARRMHNDHAEMFVEFGLIGGLLWFALIGLSVYQTIITGQWYMAGGIIAIMVNSLFFYPVRVVGIGLGLWVFIGASNPAVSAFSLPPLYIGLPVALIVAMLAWQFAMKRLMSIGHMFHFHLAKRSQDRVNAEIHIKAAMELDPMDGDLLSEFVAFYSEISPPLAMQTVMRSIDMYDGEKIEWSLWVQMGNVAVLNGAAEFARVCFRMAIYLNPSYKKPYECIAELDKLINQMGGKRVDVPEGFQEKGGLYVPDKRVVA